VETEVLLLELAPTAAGAGAFGAALPAMLEEAAAAALVEVSAAGAAALPAGGLLAVGAVELAEWPAAGIKMPGGLQSGLGVKPVPFAVGGRTRT
jgi:hypothetical protein